MKDIRQRRHSQPRTGMPRRLVGRIIQLGAAIACVFLLLPLAGSADVESRLVSLADVTTAINASSRVTLSAYTLAPTSRVGWALIVSLSG